MILPTIALIGRPNVGKSTLFNRLTGRRDAIVADFAGLTRDRKYGKATHEEHTFMLIDTGGLSDGEEANIDEVMAGQSLQAIEESDLVLLMVDGRAGFMPDDAWIVKQLRQRQKDFLLVVNKTDGVNIDTALADFYQIGQEQLFPITASHGRGVKHLMDYVVSQLPQVIEAPYNPESVRMAIVGRPNVGKSTLVNRMLGEDRVVVFDMPGTTRDSIYIDYEREGKAYTLIDTAGVRRKKNVKGVIEKFSIVKTLQAIEDANVVVLVVDAQEDLVDQDLHLLGLCMKSGRGLVIAINKWDGLNPDQRNRIKSELDRRLNFIDYAEIHFISALHGSGVGNLYKSINTAFQSAKTKLSTQKLNDILQVATEQHQPPMVSGRRIKLRYAHAGGQNPPIIVIHGNQTEKLPDHYKRYLEKTFRRELKLWGTPIQFVFKTTENPFEGRMNKQSKAYQAKQKKRQKNKKNKTF